MTQSAIEAFFASAPRVGSVSEPANGRSRIESSVASSGAVRTQLAGGWLTQLALHSSLQPIEVQYRKRPTSGLFTATPEKPYTITMGAYTVPPQMVLFLLDWRFDIYRPDGAIAGNVIPVSDRSFATAIGWNVTFSDKAPGVNSFDITPSLPVPGNPDQAPQQGVASSNAAFARMRALNTQMPGGAGQSMLPQRHRRDIQVSMPFTYLVQPQQTVLMRMIAINSVSIPLSFFEAEFSGLLVNSEQFGQFVASAAPVLSWTGNP